MGEAFDSATAGNVPALPVVAGLDRYIAREFRPRRTNVYPRDARVRRAEIEGYDGSSVFVTPE